MLGSRTPRLTRTFLALGLSFTLVASACGGDDDAPAAAPASSEGESAAAEAAQPAPAEAPAPSTPAAAEAPAPAPATPAPAPAAAPAAPKTTPAKSTAAPAKPAPAPAAAASPAPKPAAAAAAPPSGGSSVSAVGETQAVPAESAASASNGGATDVGITADQIKLGGIYMYGYALGNIAIQPMHREMQAVVKAVNDTGGIHGRRLKYVDCDDGAPDPARTQACYKKLVHDEKIFAFMGGLTFTEAQYQADIEKDQIPNISPASLYREVWQNQFAFPIHMDMTQEAIANANWVVKKHNPKTFGIICLNTAEMLEACKKAEAALAEKGVKQVFKRVYVPGTPDMSGDIIAARAANPEHILHYTVDPTVTIRFFLDAQQQNYWPPKGISGNHLAGEIVGGLMGEYPAKQGYWTNTTYKLWGADYIAWHRKFVPSNKGMSNHILQGQWFGANVATECMRRIGPELTRKALMACMTSQMWETGPGLGQKFLWEKGKRYSAGTGNTLEYMYQYVNKNTHAEDDGTGNPKGLILDAQIEAPAVDPHTGTG